jgi:hypothetical protein
MPGVYVEILRGSWLFCDRIERTGGIAVALPMDQVPVGEGKAPDGQGVAMFYVERALLDALRDEGPEWQLEDARFLTEAIREPDAIFEGLNRPGMEDGAAYSVRPTHDPEAEGAEGPPRYGFVFVVYARPCPWGYVIFGWEWREENDEPGHPAGWEADFSRRTWNRT